jgi:hypothetical protein
MRRNRIAIAVTAGAVLGFTGMSGAADAAKCGAQPDGIVVLPGPDASWDSPGEVISYLNKNGITRSSDFDAPAGQLVKLLCAGPNG